MNHQQVIAELMHIADRPVDPQRGFARAVPIFVTGNNLGKLYAPLRRPRRMHTFEWTPTPHEVEQVAQFWLADIADQAAISAVARKFADQPLAFFADLKHSMVEKHYLRKFSSKGTDMRALLSQEHYSGGVSLRVPAANLLQHAHALKPAQVSALQNLLDATPRS